VLKLRGGLAGVDTNTVATAATCITGLNAVYCALAPEPAAEAYGVKGASFNVVQMIKALGNTNLMVVVLAACLLKGVDTNTAIAWSQLPWIIGCLDAIFNGTGEKMGQPAFAQPLLLAISAATMYCGFTGTNMPLAGQLNAGWGLLNGVGAALVPDKLASAWGMSGDSAFNAMMKNFGFALCSASVLAYCVASGQPFIQSLGYAWAVLLVGLVDQKFVSKTFDDIGGDDGPLYAWMAISAAVTAGLLA
jgi:hypothetical protein